MLGELGGTIFSWSLGALILSVVLLFWPTRKFVRVSMEMETKAPREAVWAAISDPEVQPLFSEKIVSGRMISDDPPMFELQYSWHGKTATEKLMPIVYERLDMQAPELCRQRLVRLGGKAFPNGSDSEESWILSEGSDGGTRIAHFWQGEVRCLENRLRLRSDLRKDLAKIKGYCEGTATSSTERDCAETKAGSKKGLMICLGLSALAIASFALIFGWLIGAIVAAILVFHELGHWLALRLTGHPAPKFTLVPFFGGVALGNHPHDSLFDDAFVALMGPGFSALLCAGLLGVALGFNGPLDWAHHTAVLEAGTPFEQSVLMAGYLAIIVAAINLLQLIPILPFDGGQVLRAMSQSLAPNLARGFLIIITLFGVGASLWSGLYFFAGVFVIGGIQVLSLGELGSPRRMSAVGFLTIGLGYIMTAAIHVSAIYYGFVIHGLV